MPAARTAALSLALSASSGVTGGTGVADAPDSPASPAGAGTGAASEQVSALLDVPAAPRAAFVLAHGAGAGMHHPFMAKLAAGLVERGIAVLRYQFAYMERGSKRPDAPPLAHAAVRAAVAEAARQLPGLPLVAGGKSFGGRMSSQAQAASALPGVRGLVFVGFPLHPAGQPATTRADHLHGVAPRACGRRCLGGSEGDGCPMLFLQGTRDELAGMALVQGVVARLGERATLEAFDDADHSFHVRARSGQNDAQVMARLLDRTAAWIGAMAATPSGTAASAR